jgi:hypothetical protein
MPDYLFRLVRKATICSSTDGTRISSQSCFRKLTCFVLMSLKVV